MTKQTSSKKNASVQKDATGITFEKIVARIQQMMDLNSTVTHNERLEDRVGNQRQYDVVIRGQFGGRPILGVIECKDHSRKKGPDTIEAFAKKTENLGANLRIIVSKKGFTEQALRLAKHENVGCISLLPEDPKQAGFSIGDMWYGVITTWKDVRLSIYFATPPAPINTFNIDTVKWNGKPVVSWFIRELLTKYSEEVKDDDINIELMFDMPRNIEIEGQEYAVIGLTGGASRSCIKKRKWVSWSGDAFFDWHTNQFTIPANGTVVGSAVETDLSVWPDYDGEIPERKMENEPGFVQIIIYSIPQWDITKNDEVPDLLSL